jgi:hypothetical protein
MVEVMPTSQLTFEDSSWEKISHFDLQNKNPQKLGGPMYGVGRKVSAGKTLFSAKLPAASSLTGKTVKLGLFASEQEASAAVQYALQNPTFHLQDADIQEKSVVAVVREQEILEPSFCEREVPMKREYREKQARKGKALSKKSAQRDSQNHIGEQFVLSLKDMFEHELKDIKSWSRFSRALDHSVAHLMQSFFPKKGDMTNENNKAGAFDFSREVLIALWHHEHDGKSNNEEEWCIKTVDDFVNKSNEEGYSQQYGSWVEHNVFDYVLNLVEEES